MARPKDPRNIDCKAYGLRLWLSNYLKLNADPKAQKSLTMRINEIIQEHYERQTS